MDNGDDPPLFDSCIVVLSGDEARIVGAVISAWCSLVGQADESMLGAVDAHLLDVEVLGDIADGISRQIGD